MHKLTTLQFFKALILVCFTLLSVNTFAAGTAAGTNISNTVTVNYDIATVPQSPITSNTVSFVVDNKINLAVTTLDTSEVDAGAG